MSARAGMSTSAASASAAGASASFRTEFIPYNKIHDDLKGLLPKFTDNVSKLYSDINTASALLSTDITSAVIKKKAFEELNTVLLGLTKNYTEIHDGITVNNGKLEELKVHIKAAIAAKKLAAAAAKADKDAAHAAVQGQIEELKKVIDTRNAEFETELTLKNQLVVHMVQKVIPNKVDEITQLLLHGEHISQKTRDMVKDIEDDISRFKGIVDFESIAQPFKVKHENELAAIREQIGALTGAMSGDITVMQDALKSTQLSGSTTLSDFIGEAGNFNKTFDAKLADLDKANKRVNAAIAEDLKTFQEEEAKIRNLQSKIDAVVDSQAITAIIKSIDNKIAEVQAKRDIVDRLPDNTTPVNKQLKISGYSTSIYGLKVELMKLDGAINESLSPLNNFDTIKQQLNDIQTARTSRGIDAQTSLSILNQKIQGFQDKRKEFNYMYNTHHDDHERISAAMLQSRSPSPIVPVPPSERRPTSAAPRRSTTPIEAWTEKQTMKPTTHTYDPILAEAALESENITSRAPITGARRNFLHISHNTNPPTAYLVVVKKPRLDDSRGQGGGNKPYHIQKGGAGDPPPDNLPEDSEIFPINVDVDVDNPTFLGVMAGLIPPSVLLKVNDNGGGEHPIIQKIRRGTPLLGNNIALYNKIKRELITQENKNPLTIGLRAVYYRNIIELIRYLDKILSTRPHKRRERRPTSASASASSPQPASSPGIRPASASSSPPPSRGISPLSIRPGAASAAASVEPPLTCEDMYTRLRKFLNYTDGTYGVVAALFENTFHKKIDDVIPIIVAPRLRPAALLQPNRRNHRQPLSNIDDKKEVIKRIVGWENNTSNTNFNKLIDNFSKVCPPKNEFLTRENPTNLGSNPYAYNQFRLNWIILLAFHTLYIKKTEPERVGELIKTLYDAFLGWMTMTGHKDTVNRIFSNTLVTNTPSDAYSDEVEKQMKIAVGDPTLRPLIKDIQEKLCELENNKIPVIEVLHSYEYDDGENDTDYVPPEGGDSDSSDGGTSEAAAEAAAELRLLSPPEEGLSKTRSQQPRIRQGSRTPDELHQSGPHVPTGDPHPADSDFSGSDVEIEPIPPNSDLGSGQDGTQSAKTDTIKRQVQVGRRIPAGWLTGQSSGPPQKSLQVGRPGALSTFHPVAIKDAADKGLLFPLVNESAVPGLLSLDSIAAKPTQKMKPTPPATSPPSDSSRTRINTGVRLIKGKGGSNKKRTRKHKKHTSISVSRRPTRRRRRIPPTEGHKYTRKRPRT